MLGSPGGRPSLQPPQRLLEASFVGQREEPRPLEEERGFQMPNDDRKVACPLGKTVPDSGLLRWVMCQLNPSKSLPPEGGSLG